MTRDLFVKQMLPETVDMTPSGLVADELCPEEFAPLAEQFFSNILEISKADISGVEGNIDIFILDDNIENYPTEETIGKYLQKNYPDLEIYISTSLEYKLSNPESFVSTDH